jgi:hypothetical protein
MALVLSPVVTTAKPLEKDRGGVELRVDDDLAARVDVAQFVASSHCGQAPLLQIVVAVG